MICPKCRKIYPAGTQSCPECGSQLIALMGEADAPIDENNDNLSSLDRVFGIEAEGPEIILDSQNGEEAAASDIPSEEQADEEDSVENEATVESEIVIEPEIEENEALQEEVGEETESETEEAEEAEFEIDSFTDNSDTQDEENIFSFADNINVEIQSYDDGEIAENDLEEDVKIFISSADESFEVSDSVYTESYEQPEYYEEEYEVTFDDEESENIDLYDDSEQAEGSNEEEYEQEDELEPEEKELEETKIGSATVYKTSEKMKAPAHTKGKKAAAEKSVNAVEINEKTTNAISIFIFAMAVLMIIASVVCFAMGNTTELSEMLIENCFGRVFELIN